TLFLLALLAERRGDATEATAFYRESLDLLLRDRDLIQALGIIHQCARLLSGAGDHERVMLLIGAMDALRDRVSIPIHPRALAERAAWQQRATARLGADTCDQLSRRGRSSTLEETVAIARTAQVPSLHAGALSPWSLTPREQDVLALLVEGLTDQEIADRLFRSRRTINTHVANILAKMDVPGRRQAIQRARSSERVNS
ncbi:MAG: LuxR C-terminal-related transcriptional regulator, partial [Thermomicrobiales bacterium]